MAGKRQTIDGFFEALSFSLAKEFTQAVNNSIARGSPVPKRINFYGASFDMVYLISEGTKPYLKKAGCPSIPISLNQLLLREDYGIDVGWFLEAYERNGHVVL